ncbi:hypothetical protein K439DRAFT_1643143 [Ramaria rubella]|nr:hypothetical protein K439DRAFT_1643143 [Ramaria rubella]
MQRLQRNSSNAQGDTSAHDRIRDCNAVSMTKNVVWLSPRCEYQPPPTVKIDMHVDSGE